MSDDNAQRIGYALATLDSSIRSAGLLVFLGLVIVGLALLWKRSSKP